MRNRHEGACYRCGKKVAPGEGHAERRGGTWVLQHSTCCLKAREIDYLLSDDTSEEVFIAAQLAAGEVEMNISHWQSDRTEAQEREFLNLQKMRESSRIMAYHRALHLACGGDKKKAADFMEQAYSGMEEIGV